MLSFLCGLLITYAYLRPRDTGAPLLPEVPPPRETPPRVTGVLLVARELLREKELPRLLGCALNVELVLLPLLRLGVEYERS